MTLDKWLASKKTGKIRLGSEHGSGYFYCGTVEDLLRHGDIYSMRVYDRAKFLKSKAASTLDMMTRNEPTPLVYFRKDPNGTGEGYVKYVDQWLSNMRKKTKTLEKRTEYLKNFVPLMDRPVRSVYDATAYDEDTKIIIIDGNETGAYWTVEEAIANDEPMKFSDSGMEDADEALGVAV